MFNTIVRYQNKLCSVLKPLRYSQTQVESFLKTKELKRFEGYEILPLTENYFESGWSLLNETFLKEEKTCKFLNLHGAPEARRELKKIFLWIFEDGVSLMARDTKNKKIVAINLNKVWQPEDQDTLYKFKTSCKHPAAKKYFQEIMDVDLLKICKADCIFETIMSASLKDIRGLGIPTEMFRISIDLAKKLAEENVEAQPEVMASILTHDVAKHAGEKLGLKNKIEYKKEVSYNGNTIEIDSLIMYSHLV